MICFQIEEESPNDMQIFFLLNLIFHAIFDLFLSSSLILSQFCKTFQLQPPIFYSTAVFLVICANKSKNLVLVSSSSLNLQLSLIRQHLEFIRNFVLFVSDDFTIWFSRLLPASIDDRRFVGFCFSL